MNADTQDDPIRDEGQPVDEVLWAAVSGDLSSRELSRLRRELSEAEDALTAVERAETPDEDAIAVAEANVEKARNALSDRISEETSKGSTDIAGVQIEGRIAVIENRIRMLTKQVETSEQEIASLQDRIARTPEIERGITGLTRDYNNLFKEYQEVLWRCRFGERPEP